MTTQTADVGDIQINSVPSCSKFTAIPSRVRLSAAKPAEDAPPRIDRQARIIRGYSAAQSGEALGHGFELDDETLNSIEAFGQAAGETGIKSRFTHPNLSGDGLGTYLGRSKNFRRQGDRVLADLHFDPTASQTPDGDLAGYVMDLAESDPMALGASVVMSGDSVPRLNEDGTPQTGADGKRLPPVYRPKRLHAVDVVDEPAANRDGFLSANTEPPDWAARQATAVLDRLFAGQTADVITARVESFLQRYLSNISRDITGDQRSAISDQKSEINNGAKPMSESQTTTTLSLDPAIAAKQDADLAAAKQEATLAEQRRILTINSLCEKAGCQQIAGKLISEQCSIDQAKSLVLEAMLSRNNILGDDPKPCDKPKKTDPDAAARAEYQANAARLSRLGVSEADYLFSHRVDSGLEQLMPTC